VVVAIRGHVIITTQEIRPTTTSNFPTVSVVLDTQEVEKETAYIHCHADQILLGK
jgi:hypothetical protein